MAPPSGAASAARAAGALWPRSRGRLLRRRGSSGGYTKYTGQLGNGIAIISARMVNYMFNWTWDNWSIDCSPRSRLHRRPLPGTRRTRRAHCKLPVSHVAHSLLQSLGDIHHPGVLGSADCFHVALCQEVALYTVVVKLWPAGQTGSAVNNVWLYSTINTNTTNPTMSWW